MGMTLPKILIRHRRPLVVAAHLALIPIGYFLAFVGFMGIIWQGAAIRPMVKRYGELLSLRIAFIALVRFLLSAPSHQRLITSTSARFAAAAGGTRRAEMGA